MSRVEHVNELGPAQVANLWTTIHTAVDHAAEALAEIDIRVGPLDIVVSSERDSKDADALFTVEPTEQGLKSVITFFFPDVGGQDGYDWLFTSFENAADVARLVRDQPSYSFAAHPIYGLPVRGANLSRLRQLVAHEMAHLGLVRALGRDVLLLEEHNSTWFKLFQLLQIEMMVTKPQVEATHGMVLETPFEPLKVRMHA